MSIFQKAVTAEQRIQNAHASIIAHERYRALAGVMAIGTKTISDDIPTACTNGRDVLFSRDMVMELTLAQLRFVLLHEDEGHKLFRHLITFKWMFDENQDMANKALDYWVNGRLCDDNKKDGFAQMPTGKYAGLYDERFRGSDGTWLDPTTIYRMLKDDEDGNQGGNTSQDGDSGNGFDTHDWDTANELSEEESKDLAREINTAIRHGLMAGSKLGDANNLVLEELVTPQIDWREVLREFVQSTCVGHDYTTWARPNRRYMAADVFMPATYSETVEELLINCDTSYSVMRRIPEFLSEIQDICKTVKPERVRILYWGSSVVGDEVYDADNISKMVELTQPKEGGGTEIECVVDYMDEHDIKPQAVINFTDGELFGGWGTWDCPVLWCVIDNKKATPDVGKVLHIKSKDMGVRR